MNCAKRPRPWMKSGAFDITSAEALAESAPVRKLLNMVLLLAIKDHASDIHLRAVRRRVPHSHQGGRRAYSKWCRRRGIWHSRSRPASRSWRTWTSPSGACRRTAASS